MIVNNKEIVKLTIKNIIFALWIVHAHFNVESKMIPKSETTFDQLLHDIRRFCSRIRQVLRDHVYQKIRN